MARRKKGQLLLKLGVNDERIPKLMGMVSIFLGLYLLIAFISYLFTWHLDQDRVLRFSWQVLLFESDMDMANWLGRLGAIVSNLFFYWGFGLPSFIVVFIMGYMGVRLIRRTPLRVYIGQVQRFVLLMLFLSVFLASLFARSAFPWGGAFGELVSEWLLGFLGVLGLILLYVFIFAGIFIWVFNPNFNEQSFQEILLEAREYAADLLTGKAWRRQKRQAAANKALSPRVVPAAKEKPANAEKKIPGQLTFDLPAGDRDEDAISPTAHKGADSELEIEAPPFAARDGNGSMPPPSHPAYSPLALQEENQDHSEPYDPTLELASYEHPVLSLLDDYSDQQVEIDRAELEANKDQIIETLLNYKIEIVKIKATIGPTVTLYEIVPAPGVRISRIKNLEDDIALSLAALGIRIIAPIPGKGTIGIEVPNRKKQVVSMREVLQSEKFKRAKMDLPIALGKTINNEVFVADLAKMPHLLMAGATGQGKSVGINAVIISLLYKKHPSQVKLVLIDPKKVELFPYSALERHFLAFLPGQEEPITTETNKVIYTLNSLCIEMDERYDLLKKAGSRNIREYNEKFVQRRLNPLKGHRFMPFIVLVIDEFADLIMTAGKEIEMPIGRLAQLARAVGIHLIIATQRPSVNIITGVIKANFPARIAYKVSAKVDSRTILDAGGADQLIGRGDMLLSVGGEMVRLQCAFVDTPEVERVIDFIAKQPGYPEPYLLPEFHGDDAGMEGTGPLKYSDLDDMFEDAARLIVQNQHGSTSMIQRRLKLGYNRAGRIMDQLEAMGIVGPSEGSKAREVLIYDEIELNKYLGDLRERK
jgi:S-DNA-T family DNA segregation ATPase FtsK/SpoIIIE